MAGIVKDSWGQRGEEECARERPREGRGSDGLEWSLGHMVRRLTRFLGAPSSSPGVLEASLWDRQVRVEVEGGEREVSSAGHLGSITSLGNTVHQHPENATCWGVLPPAPQVPTRNDSTLPGEAE